MDCPKCVGVMKQLEVGEMEGKPTYIEQCQICSGIWFDKGELDRVLSLKIKFVETAEQFNKSLVESELDKKTAVCPRCKKEMARISAPKDDRIKMDFCPECDGCWLDGGELAQLQRGNILKRAWDCIRNKFAGLGTMHRPQY